MPTRASSQQSPTEQQSLLLLDTHVAIWLAEGNSRLKASVVSRLEQAFNSGELTVSPISAWEIGILVSKNKLDLSGPPLDWFKSFTDAFNVQILELSAEIAIQSSFLPGSFHGDPADRMLVASALANSATLVSADKQIISYGKQGFLNVLAC